MEDGVRSKQTEAIAAPGVQVTGLHVSYQGTVALRDVSFQLPAGAMTAIIGPNGAGKSTLFKAIMGLVTPDRGSVRILGEPVARIRHRIAYVPQRDDVDWTFPISALDTALLGTYPRLGLLRRPGASERSTAREALATLGMADYANRQIGQLSGGQQQRVFIARALAQQAEAILLDEPFVGVDETSEELIVDILRQLRQAGTTILAIHHDLGSVQRYFDRAVLLNRSLLGAGPIEQVLVPEVLAQAYEAARLTTSQQRDGTKPSR